MVTHDSNYDYKRNMFLAAKDQNRSLLDQYNDLTQKKVALEKTHRETNTAGQQIEYIREEIQEIKSERNVLSNEFDNIMRKPFFAKEFDKDGQSKLQDIQAQIDRFQADNKKTRANIKVHSENIKETESKLKEQKKDYEIYNDKLKKHISMNDPSELTLKQITNKLKNEDESRFREIMTEIQTYCKPQSKEDIMGRKHGETEFEDQKLRQKEIDRLKKDKHSLAAQL